MTGCHHHCKPTELGSQTACRLLSSTLSVTLHYSAWQFILNYSLRVEGWVDLGIAGHHEGWILQWLSW